MNRCSPREPKSALCASSNLQTLLPVISDTETVAANRNPDGGTILI